MAIFGGNRDNPKQQLEQRVQDMEEQMVALRQKIAGYRAQIRELEKEETRVRTETEQITERKKALNTELEQLKQLKSENANLEKDLQDKQKKNKALLDEKNRLTDSRQEAVTSIAQLRSQIAKESQELKRVEVEQKKITDALKIAEEKKKRLQSDIDILNMTEKDIANLDNQYKNLTETNHVNQKKLEETRNLMQKIEKAKEKLSEMDPVNKAVKEIWSKLPADLMDGLVSTAKPNQK